MAKPKRSDRETVVTLRLPRELHERLKTASGGHGFAAEVRRWLEALFPAEPLDDPKTRALIKTIADIANQVQGLNARPWHADAFSFLAFRHALGKVLDARQPAGEARVNPDGLGGRVLWDADVSPEEAGNAVAAAVLSDLQKEHA